MSGWFKSRPVSAGLLAVACIALMGAGDKGNPAAIPARSRSPKRHAVQTTIRKRDCRVRYRLRCAPTDSRDSTATWSSSVSTAARERTGRRHNSPIRPGTAAPITVLRRRREAVPVDSSSVRA
jgi:hypothetical protein